MFPDDTSMFSFSMDQTLYEVDESDGTLQICVAGELNGESVQLYFMDGSATLNGRLPT